MKELFAFVFGFSLSTFVFWLSGFDFDRRGELLAQWFAFSMVAGVAAFFLLRLWLGAKEKRTLGVKDAALSWMFVFVFLFMNALAVLWFGGADLTHRSPKLVAELGDSLLFAFGLSFFHWFRWLWLFDAKRKLHKNSTDKGASHQADKTAR